jgi:hypothetical protein
MVRKADTFKHGEWRESLVHYDVTLPPDMTADVAQMAKACGIPVEQFIAEAVECLIAQRRISHQ